MTTIIKFLADMPAPRTTPVGGIWCSQCDHEKEVSDPYGTGDHWYTVRECTAPKCPYGKLDMDWE